MNNKLINFIQTHLTFMRVVHLFLAIMFVEAGMFFSLVNVFPNIYLKTLAILLNLLLGFFNFRWYMQIVRKQMLRIPDIICVTITIQSSKDKENLYKEK